MRGACHLDGRDAAVRGAFLTVADSCAGVDAEADLFSRGRRPAPDADRVHGLGVGLPLSRELARRRGGDVWLIEAAGTSALTGALFGARLCGVLAERPGYHALAPVRTLADATAAVRTEQPDLLLVDAYLPDGDGIAFVRENPIDAFVLSAATDAVTVLRALRAGALGYLVKPFERRALVEVLDRYARFRNVLDEERSVSQDEIDRALGILHAGGDTSSVSRSATERVILGALGGGDRRPGGCLARHCAAPPRDVGDPRDRGRAFALRHHGAPRAPVRASTRIAEPACARRCTRAQALCSAEPCT
jgi:DNA-binding NarL/FixJ family response regulator